MALWAVAPVFAQKYPERPLRFVVPFPPGGGTDLIARAIGKNLSDRFGQPVVVDNRAGANGSIGAGLVARAAPDGHTLLMIISTHTVLPSLQPKLSYDLVRDFAAVIHVANLPNVVVARNALPVNSIADLVALAKKSPDQIRYAGAGMGGPSHLSAVLFSHMTGVKMLHVPYKGTGPAMIDLLGGHVDLMFATAPGAMPHVRSGKLKALAVTSLMRSTALPDVPTVSEAGVKDYEFVSWYGVVVRAGTPSPIVQRLHSAIAEILRADELRKLIDNQGGQITARGPSEFDAYIRTEVKRWSEILADTNMKPE